MKIIMQKKASSFSGVLYATSEKEGSRIEDEWPIEWIYPIVDDCDFLLYGERLSWEQKNDIAGYVARLLFANQVAAYECEDENQVPVYNQLNILKALLRYRLSTIDYMRKDPSLISWCKGYEKLLSFSHQIVNCEMLLTINSDLIEDGLLESEAAHVWKLVEEMQNAEPWSMFYLDGWPNRLAIFTSEVDRYVHIVRFNFDREIYGVSDQSELFKLNRNLEFFHSCYRYEERHIGLTYTWTQDLPPFKEVEIFVDSCVEIMKRQADPWLTVSAEFCLLSQESEYSSPLCDLLYSEVDNEYLFHPVLSRLSDASNNYLNITLEYNVCDKRVDVHYYVDQRSHVQPVP